MRTTRPWEYPDDTMTIAIERLSGGTGLEIEDRIEQRQCQLRTPTPVSVVDVSTDRLPYPLDRAIAFHASEVTLPQVPNAYIREADGRFISEVEQFSEVDLGPGTYIFEVVGPVKLFLEVEGPLSYSVDTVTMTLEFPAESEITVGVRSYHERPAETISTSAEPAAVMEAISYLPSSLKTTSPERAYPTLRGHPPEFELADELSVPDVLTRPETGVTVEVPLDLGDLFVVAPLVFYLGASVEPADHRAIVTDHGFTHPLGADDAFEREVERVLKQTFLLDCLVRTEGIYDMPLYERDLADERADLDYGALYDASPPRRLERYLSLPYDALRELVPQWKLTAHVAPRAESIETLPFLVDDLAVVRTPNSEPSSGSNPHQDAIDAFTRAGVPDDDCRGADEGADGTLPPVFEPGTTDSIEQAWVGEDVPLGASKTMARAFRNRLDREESAGNVDIVVVCNDEAMTDEHLTASEVYGSREDLPFDVTTYDDLTTDRLAIVLESSIDFFHYIGHIEADGFQCSDGYLDVESLSSVGVDTFFLNACSSYRQGMELIEKGAIGGVVTLDDIINSGAIRVGETMTRLLNRGFPLRAALTIASDRSIIGSQYIVVGDGNMDIAHGESMVPNLLEITDADVTAIDLLYRTYYSAHFGLGATIRPYIASNHYNYLVGSSLAEFRLPRAEVENFLDLQVVPIQHGRELLWSDQLDIDEL